MPATSLHRAVPPFYTALPKPSHHRSVSRFWLKPHSPASVGERAAAPPVDVLSAHARHLSASPRTAIFHSTPETELLRLVFIFSAFAPLNKKKNFFIFVPLLW